jgi:uncharacterized protein YkwD
MVFRWAAAGLVAVGVVFSAPFASAKMMDAPARTGRRGCPPAVEIPTPWPAASVRSEDDVLAVINRYREQGATCRATRTRHRPVPPLEGDDALREAARGHSTYMARTGAFDHTLAGCAFSTWIDAAGYEWSAIGENIAMRQGARASTGEDVVAQWLSSHQGHCETLMDPKWRAAGVGHARRGTREIWTVDFGDR